MLGTTRQLHGVAYGNSAIRGYNINDAEPTIALFRGNVDFRAHGKVFMDEYANFIASRDELLGSAGQLEAARGALS